MKIITSVIETRKRSTSSRSKLALLSTILILTTISAVTSSITKQTTNDLIRKSKSGAEEDEKSDSSSQTPQSVYLVEIYTSGAKSPKKDYLKSGFYEDLGYNQLTPNGQRQQYLLGNQIRVENLHLFNSLQDRSKVETYSRRAEANLDSAFSHLSGLFPPGTGLKVSGNTFNKEITYPPYRPFKPSLDLKTIYSVPNGASFWPIHSFFGKDDNLFNYEIGKVCPVAKYDAAQQSRALIISSERILNKIGGMVEKSGLDPKTLFNQTGYDFESLALLSKALRAWYYHEGVYLANLNKSQTELLRVVETYYYMALYFPSDGFLKLYTHNITKIVYKRLLGFLPNTTKCGPKNKKKLLVKQNEQQGAQFGDRNVYLGFSSDEMTILPFLVKIGKTSRQCLRSIIVNPALLNTTRNKCITVPDPASTLLITLNKNVSKTEKSPIFEVLVTLNGSPVDFCRSSNTANSTNHPCPLTEFLTVLKNDFMYFDDENYNFFCGSGYTGKKLETNIFLMILTLSSFLIVLSAVIFWLYVRALSQEVMKHYDRTLLVPNRATITTTA